MRAHTAQDSSGHPLLARRTAGMQSSKLRELIAVSTGGTLLSLAGGLPPPEAYPAEALAAAADRILTGSRADSALRYTPTEGDPQMLEVIRTDLLSRLGLSDTAGRILVTTGSQQALDLVAKVLIDPGDTAVVESPGYVGALRALAAYQPELVGVPVDHEGMDTDALAQLLTDGLRPKLCYLVPNFSNPTGTTLSASRRSHLAELSASYGFVVIEDDPYGQLRFTGGDVAPVVTHGDHILYLGSFSKVIAPGLRVGYAVVPRCLFRPMAVAKQATDLNSSALSQKLVSELLESPDWFDGHVRMLRGLYRDRATALVQAVSTTLGGRMTVSRPQGGMFAWASMTAGEFDAIALARAGMHHGVAMVPADEFTVVDSFPRELRLSFSMLAPAQFGDAVDRILLAFEDLGA